MHTKALFSVLFQSAVKPKISIFSTLLLLPLSAHADLHASLSGTSNYIDRWFSKSNNDWTVKADFDYEHELGFYVGSKLAKVKFPPMGEDRDELSTAEFEAIPYIGYSYTINSDWKVGTEINRYLFNGIVCGHDVDYNEYYASVTFRDVVTTRASYVDDYWGTHRDVFNYDVTGKYSVTDYLDISATAGYTTTRNAVGSDHSYWNIGATYFYKVVSLDIRYMDTAQNGTIKEFHLPESQSFEPTKINSSFVFTATVGF